MASVVVNVGVSSGIWAHEAGSLSIGRIVEYRQVRHITLARIVIPVIDAYVYDISIGCSPPVVCGIDIIGMIVVELAFIIASVLDDVVVTDVVVTDVVVGAFVTPIIRR